MKILIVSPVFPGSLGAYCRTAFEELGHSVRVFDYRAQAFGTGYLTRKRRPLWQKFYSRLVPPVPKMNRRLVRLAETARPDAILVIKGELIFPETVRKIAEDLSLPVLLWYPDAAGFLSTRTALKNIANSLQHYSITFFGDVNEIAPELRAEIKSLEYLTFGCDPRVHKHWPLTMEEQAFYGSEVCFIGNSHGEGSIRDTILGSLVDFDLRIWGTAWERTELYRQCPSIFRRPAYGDELAKIYSASKIAININGDYPYMNVRNFEAPACGILLLTSDIPPLPNYYRVNQEVVVYRDIAELRSKLTYYLTHAEERVAIARAGQERSYTEHTVRHRVQEMISKLGET